MSINTIVFKSSNAAAKPAAKPTVSMEVIKADALALQALVKCLDNRPSKTAGKKKDNGNQLARSAATKLAAGEYVDHQTVRTLLSGLIVQNNSGGSIDKYQSACGHRIEIWRRAMVEMLTLAGFHGVDLIKDGYIVKISDNVFFTGDSENPYTWTPVKASVYKTATDATEAFSGLQAEYSNGKWSIVSRATLLENDSVWRPGWEAIHQLPNTSNHINVGIIYIYKQLQMLMPSEVKVYQSAAGTSAPVIRGQMSNKTFAILNMLRKSKENLSEIDRASQSIWQASIEVVRDQALIIDRMYKMLQQPLQLLSAEMFNQVVKAAIWVPHKPNDVMDAYTRAEDAIKLLETEAENIALMPAETNDIDTAADIILREAKTHGLDTDAVIILHETDSGSRFFVSK